jgi:hypothetical protein
MCGSEALFLQVGGEVPERSAAAAHWNNSFAD